MATGMQHILVICVALNPFFASLVCYIINWSNGSSFLFLDELGKNMGVDSWDVTTMFIKLFFEVFVPPVSFYLIKNLYKKLEDFASSFNAKLKNLVSAGID